MVMLKKRNTVNDISPNRIGKCVCIIMVQLKKILDVGYLLHAKLRE